MAGKKVLNYVMGLASVISVMESCLNILEDSDWKFLCEEIKEATTKALNSEMKNINVKDATRIKKFTKVLCDAGLENFKSHQVHVNWVLGLLSDRRVEILKSHPDHYRINVLTDLEDMLFTLYDNSEVFDKYDKQAINFLKKYNELFESEF